MEQIWKARRDIVTYSHKVSERGFVVATDGNLSVRLGEDRFMITPSGFPKGEMTVEAPIIIDAEGRVIEGAGKASVETKLHLEVYRRREDVSAVIHAHPPKCIAFTIAGVPLATCVLPEVVVTMGSVPTSEYATPSTEEVPASIRGLIEKSDVVILARHGSLTVGTSLESAFHKLEKLEQTAEISMYARLLGGVEPFREGELDRLRALREVWGVKTRAIACSEYGACALDRSARADAQPAHRERQEEPAQAPEPARGSEASSVPAHSLAMLAGGDMDRIVDYIVEQVRKRL